MITKTICVCKKHKRTLEHKSKRYMSKDGDCIVWSDVEMCEVCRETAFGAEGMIVIKIICSECGDVIKEVTVSRLGDAEIEVDPCACILAEWSIVRE